MATLMGITIVKRFTYRGDPTEEFSNQYWFKQSPPSDSASWAQAVADVYNQEHLLFGPDVAFVRAYGYNDDDPKANHVFAKDYTVPGPPPVGTRTPTGVEFAGDQAALVEWKTDALNSRGKPIYLRKYIHAGSAKQGSPDQLDTTYYGILGTYANAMRTMFGGLTNPSSSNHPGGSETAVTGIVGPYVTTRTLKRRGPRPKAG